jgi:putative ABC transport system permease protein
MLAIGQSFRRTREVGIRKVMGAFKSTLVQQYLAESFLTVFFATLLGILLANLLLPIYNELTGAAVDLSFAPWHLLLYAALIVVLGTISGIYPSVILARWNIVSILKGNHKPAQHRGLRRGMVVFQFVVTVLLISCSLIMNQQMNFMTGHDPGYDYTATVTVPLYADRSSQSFMDVQRSAMERGGLLKEKLAQYPEISRVGMGSHVFGSAGWAQIAFPDDNDNFHKLHMLIVDPYYFETFGIEVVQGRAMDPDNPADARQAIILNEAAVREFGLEDPVGKKLPNSDFDDHQIIGVTADFNYESLHVNVDPLIITSNSEILFPGITDTGFPTDPTPKLVFKFSGSSLLSVKEILESSWNEVFPEEDLSFSFVEENMQSLYASEIRMQRLVLLATVLSIIIASLGLLGLTVIMVNSRIKEISIRKVVGASEKMIYGMLVKNVSVQLLIAILVAVPITYLLMSDWLNEFAYHINIGPGVFVASAVLSLLVVLVVISYHTWLAARTNPSDTLRSE